MKNIAEEYGNSQSEAQITYHYKHHFNEPKPPKYILDNVNVFNIKGDHMGYSWNYGDSVCIDINMQDTNLFCNDEDHFILSELFLKGKKVQLDLIDIRGAVRYSFEEMAHMITSFLFNTNESNTINKNSYKLEAYLIDEGKTKTSLFNKPLNLLVK